MHDLPGPSQCKDGAAALRVFEDMRARGVSPDVVAYTSLLVALQGAPQVKPAGPCWHSSVHVMLLYFEFSSCFGFLVWLCASFRFMLAVSIACSFVSFKHQQLLRLGCLPPPPMFNFKYPVC
jgi:pentatricopeptide repeat protein